MKNESIKKRKIQIARDSFKKHYIKSSCLYWIS